MTRAPQDPLARRARRIFAELGGFPRQFWLQTAGFLVLLSGIDMCFPFETSYLNGKLGVSMTTIGLILGLPLIGAIPFYILGGALTDRFGRKPAMAVGITVDVALYLTFALTGSLWQIALAIAIEAAMGWSFFLTASNAMVADLVPLERRAEAYSITRVSLHIGMIIGPLLGGIILARDPTYHMIFFAGAGICALYVVIEVLLFRETKPPVAGSHESFARTFVGFGHVLKDRRFLAFCAVSLLPLYGFGQIWATLPVALRQVHGTTPRAWSLLLVFYALSVAIFQYPVIRWLRGRNELFVMAAASVFMGLGMGLAVLAPAGWTTLLAMFLIGQSVVMLIPIPPSYAARLAPAAMRGRYMGAWTLVQEVGYALGPVFGGISMDHLGAHGAFAVTGACGLLGGLLFAAMALVRRARATASPGSPAQAQSGVSAADAEAARAELDAIPPAPPEREG